MKKILLIAVAAAGLCAGCQNKEYEDRVRAQNKYYDDHYPQYQTKNCVTEHLNEMEGKSIQRWDATLYAAVAKECNMLFLNSAVLPGVLLESQVCTARTCVTVKDVRPSDVKAPVADSCSGCGRCQGCEACILSKDATLRSSSPCQPCLGCEKCLGCKIYGGKP